MSFLHGIGSYVVLVALVAALYAFPAHLKWLPACGLLLAVALTPALT